MCSPLAEFLVEDVLCKHENKGLEIVLSQPVIENILQTGPGMKSHLKGQGKKNVFLQLGNKLRERIIVKQTFIDYFSKTM